MATAGQVRREVARQLGTVPRARWWFLLAVVLLGVGSYATVLVPQLMGQIVDLVTGNGAAKPMWRIGIELIVLSVAGAAMSAAGFYLVARLSERVIANLRQDMVGTALGLPTHQVEDAGTGDLVSRSTDDVAELSAAVTETLPTLSTSLFSILATVIALLALDWYFVLIPVVVAPVYYVAARMYLARAPQRYAAERAAMAERARRVLEAIRGRATVRAFSMEDRMHTEIENASWSVVRKGITARTTMLVLNTWMLGIEFLMLTMALAVGYYLVSTDVLTVGAVTGAVLMIIRLRGPMNTLMRVLDVVQSGYASLARIVGVVSDPPVPVPDSGADAPRGRVELRDVSFSYGGGWAVRNVDLTINPGETVAIVGASGAGKTTVAALLAGLRVPDAGEVLVDGYPVSQLSDSERIARLATVSQEVHVFSGTLRQDMTLAKPDATDAELLLGARPRPRPLVVRSPALRSRHRGRLPRSPAGTGRRTAAGAGPDPAPRPGHRRHGRSHRRSGLGRSRSVGGCCRRGDPRPIGAGGGAPPRPGLPGRQHPGDGRRRGRRTRHPRPAARPPRHLPPSLVGVECRPAGARRRDCLTHVERAHIT